MSEPSETGPSWDEPEPSPAPALPVKKRRWWRFDDGDAAALLRSLLLLAVVGVSVVHFCNLVRAAWLADFISSNTLRARMLFNQEAAAGGAVGVGLGLVLRFMRPRAAGLVRLQATARWLAPLALLGLLPGLFSSRAWPDQLNMVLAFAAVVLGFEPLMRVHLGADRAALPWAGLRARLGGLWARLPPLPGFLRRWGPLLFVVCCALGYAAYASFYTIRNHWHFNTFDYDLGQYDNIFYNALRGRPMRCTPLIREGNWTELRNHAELATYAFLPFYALSPRAEMLLAIQSTVLGLGAIPLYRFAARRLPRWIAVTLALAYLLFAPMHSANFFDFHMQPVAAGIILWMIDLFDERRYKTFAVLFLVALGCREDISVGLTVFGVFLVLTGHRVRAGALVAALAATYFVVMRFIVMPSFGQWGFEGIYKDLFPANDHSFAGVIATLISNPLYVFKTILTTDKLRYALQILVPLAFLPLRRPYLWLLLAPGSLFTILTTEYPPTTQINYQYSGHFIPYIFTAAVLALAAYGDTPEGRRRQTAAILAVALGTLLTTAHWGGIPPRPQFHSG